MNEPIQYLTQVKNKLKPKFWVPVALGTALQFYSASVFAQRNPAIAFLADIHLQEVYADLNSTLQRELLCLASGLGGAGKEKSKTGRPPR